MTSRPSCRADWLRVAYLHAVLKNDSQRMGKAAARSGDAVRLMVADRRARGTTMPGPMRVNVSGSELVPVASLTEASRAVRSHIEAHGLGASQWCGNGAGDVSVGGVVFARISYNGRVWNLDGSERT